MKRTLAVFVALGLLFCATFTLSVSATNNLDPTTPNAEVTITTTIDPDYIVIIPASTNVTRNQEFTAFGQIQLYPTSQLKPQHRVRVTVNADNEFVNTVAVNQSIPFTIVPGNTATEFTTVNLVTPGQSSPLRIRVTDTAWAAADALLAGTYNASVRFTMIYEPGGA